MLFFVRQRDHRRKKGPRSNEPPYFVRRWTPQLPRLIAADAGGGFGEQAVPVDWRRSLYLNLIAQARYHLTVAICSRSAMDAWRRRGSIGTAPSIVRVGRAVYASPSRVRVDADRRKSDTVMPAYPQIHFAVHDFESAFDSLVVSEEDHCLCVVLKAEGVKSLLRASQAAEREQKKPASATPAGGAVPAVSGGGTPDGAAATVAAASPPASQQQQQAPLPAPGIEKYITLFSGFVMYGKLRGAFQGGRGRLTSLLGRGNDPHERVVMRGPGGLGEAEVMVSRSPDLPSFDDEDSRLGMLAAPFPPTTNATQFGGAEPDGVVPHHSPAYYPMEREPPPPPDTRMVRTGSSGRLGGFLGSMVGAVVKTASDMIAPPLASDPRPPPPPEVPPRLQCCLMSVSLPWQHLANELLFKDPGPSTRMAS
eukprot:jgi/Mesvir1/18479/Mv14327-RA.1